MKRLSFFVIRFRAAVLSAVAVISIVMAYQLRTIKVNPDIIAYLPKSDPVVALFDRIGDEYRGNALAMVVFRADDVVTHRNLTVVRALTDSFRLVGGVSSVISLTNVIDIKSVNDQIEVGRLLGDDSIPVDADSLALLKRYILSKERLRNRLLSDDGQFTLIICRLRSGANEVETVRNIKSAAANAAPGAQLFFGGSPVILDEINSVIMDDLILLIPLVSILVIISLYFSFRTMRGVVLPILSVSLSTLWTLGTMAWVGVEISIISDIIPVILIAIGSAYGIHIVNKFDEAVTANASKTADAIEALSSISLPVMLAAVTTMAGFISFIFGSYLTMIREFGIFTALGVLFALLISLTLIPAILVGLPIKTRAQSGTSRDARAFDRLMNRVAEAIIRHPKRVLAAGILIIIAGSFGIPSIERRVDIYDYFKPGAPIRQTEEVMRSRFGGSVPIQIVVQGDLYEPEVLREIKRLQDSLAAMEDVHNPQSIADLIEEMSDVMGEGKHIPDSRDKVANLWFLLEGEEILEQMVNHDRTEALVQATVTEVETAARLEETVAAVDTLLRSLRNPVNGSEQTGMISIYNNIDLSILKSQYTSLAIALALIFVCLIALVGSFKGGLIGMIPISVTLVMVFGTMGYAHVPLDVATVLVGSISIGIGIDYTIHIVSRYRSEFLTLGDTRESLRRSLVSAGKAVVINVVTVTLGFLVLLLANLVPLQRFGLLGALTMVSAGLGALFLLPAVILLVPTGLIGSLRTSLKADFMKKNYKDPHQ